MQRSLAKQGRALAKAMLQFALLCSPMKPLHLLPAVALSIAFTLPAAAQLVRSAAGTNAAAIQGTVDAFRTDLGTLNPNSAGSFGSGRREINWDGVPDSFAAPNNLPANFFNVNSPRGVVFGTPGTGFQVSANAGVAPIQFGNIDPAYPTFFEPFSQQRLFTPIGSNIMDVTFFVPGSTTPALTTGFGAVFSDVDLVNLTSLQFFDASNVSLGTFFVPNVTAANESFSFLGVVFGDAVVSRVRITAGNQILAPGNLQTDLVAMDDFIYGEPRTVGAVTTPDAGSSAALLALSLGLIAIARRRQK
jgi:hypothetical protein